MDKKVIEKYELRETDYEHGFSAEYGIKFYIEDDSRYMFAKCDTNGYPSDSVLVVNENGSMYMTTEQMLLIYSLEELFF